MQVTETLNEGLKRKLSVTIPAADLNSRLDVKLEELKGQANIKGFRPGKVPTAHLKKVYGRSAMSEVMTDAINATVSDTLDKREERAAAQPKVDLPDDQSVINDVLDGKADLAFEVEYEVLPPVTLMDIKGVKLNKPVVEVSEEEVDTEVKRVFAQNRGYTDKGEDAVVADGDRLGLSFVGKIGGKEFEGGSSDHAHLTVGSGEFIPGFEEQLVGMKKGQTGEVKVTFPKDYQNEELAGKKAVFEVTILHVDGPNEGEMDDEFAKRLGLEDVAALRKAVREQMENGVIAGYPVVDCKVTVYDGSYHDVDSSEMAFKIAGSMAFREGMEKANPTLLEPIMNVEVVTPEEYMGDVMGDLNRRRGLPQGMDDTPAGKVIRAEVPLAEMFGYATDLRSMSQGRAVYSMEFAKYAEVPPNIAQAVGQ